MSSIWFVDGGGKKTEGGFGRICIVKEGFEPVVMDVLIPNCTNNLAEWIAMRGALKSCDDGDEIRSDSQLVVNQLTKGWSVNVRHLQILFDECKKLMKLKPHVQIFWISRVDNLAGHILEGDSKREFPKSEEAQEHIEEINEDADREFQSNNYVKLSFERDEFKKASEIKEKKDELKDLGVEF